MNTPLETYNAMIDRAQAHMCADRHLDGEAVFEEALRFAINNPAHFAWEGEKPEGWDEGEHNAGA